MIHGSGVEGHWNGYNGDWRNISFDTAFRLNKDVNVLLPYRDGRISADPSYTCTAHRGRNDNLHELHRCERCCPLWLDSRSMIMLS